MTPANQGKKRSGLIAIYPSARKQDRVTNDHQTWGNKAQMQSKSAASRCVSLWPLGKAEECSSDPTSEGN